MRKLLAYSILVLLAACQTPYQPLGFGGGFSETRLASDRAIIYFRGNGYTSMETARKFAFRRAAEFTVENGYSYFVVESTGQDVLTSRISDPGYVQTNCYSTGFGGYSCSSNTVGGFDTTVRKPKPSLAIRMFKGQMPEGLDSGFMAEEVLQYTQ